MDHTALNFTAVLCGKLMYVSYYVYFSHILIYFFDNAEFTSDYVESTTIITSTTQETTAQTAQPPEMTTVQMTSPEETTDEAKTRTKETTTVRSARPLQTTQPTEVTTEKPSTEAGATEAETVIFETTSKQQTTSGMTGSISTPVGGREFSLLLFFSHHMRPVFHFIQRGSNMQFS